VVFPAGEVPPGFIPVFAVGVGEPKLMGFVAWRAGEPKSMGDLAVTGATNTGEPESPGRATLVITTFPGEFGDGDIMEVPSPEAGDALSRFGDCGVGDPPAESGSGPLESETSRVPSFSVDRERKL